MPDARAVIRNMLNESVLSEAAMPGLDDETMDAMLNLIKAQLEKLEKKFGPNAPPLKFRRKRRSIPVQVKTSKRKTIPMRGKKKVVFKIPDPDGGDPIEMTYTVKVAKGYDPNSDSNIVVNGRAKVDAKTGEPMLFEIDVYTRNLDTAVEDFENEVNDVEFVINHEVAHLQRTIAEKDPERRRGVVNDYLNRTGETAPRHGIGRKFRKAISPHDPEYTQIPMEWDANIAALVRAYQRADPKPETLDDLFGLIDPLHTAGHRDEAWRRKVLKRLYKAGVELREDVGETVVPNPVYHGSDVKFQEFKRMPSKRYVLFSEFDVESPAFFFAVNVTDATEFGRNVSEWNISVRNPLINYPEQQYAAVDFDEDFARDMAYILEPMVEEDEGEKYIDLGVGRHYIEALKEQALKWDEPEESWVYAAVENEGLNWDVLDNAECVKRMAELGYDGTTVAEPDTYAGYSWAVFSPEQARFVRLFDEDEVEDRVSEEDLRETARKVIRRVLSESGSVGEEERSVPIEEVIDNLRENDGTGDEEWVEDLVEHVREYPRWKLGRIPVSDVENECADYDTAETYADEGVDNMPPIVVVPAEHGDLPWGHPLDGGHRLLAHEIAGVADVLAYYLDVDGDG